MSDISVHSMQEWSTFNFRSSTLLIIVFGCKIVAVLGFTHHPASTTFCYSTLGIPVLYMETVPPAVQPHERSPRMNHSNWRHTHTKSLLLLIA